MKIKSILIISLTILIGGGMIIGTVFIMQNRSVGPSTNKAATGVSDPVIKLTNQCINANLSANVASVSFASVMPTGSFIDVDDDNNWDNGFYNKDISNSSVTLIPDGLDVSGDQSGSLQIKPNTKYYVRIYDGSLKMSSSVISFTVPTCSTSVSTPIITLTKQCITGNQTSNVANVNFSNAMPNGSFIDVDNDNNWDNGFYNKDISSLSTTNLPDNLDVAGDQTGTMQIVPGTKYSVRIYDGTLKISSSVANFTIPLCQTVSPVATTTIIPTSNIVSTTLSPTTVISSKTKIPEALPNTGSFEDSIVMGIIGILFIISSFLIFNKKKIH